MPKDHMERRMYRKSPGRQYESEPLRSRSDKSQSGRGENTEQSERWVTRGSTGQRSTTASLAQRPDPRRTRQLLRQNIIASKARQAEEEDQEQYISSSLEEYSSRHGSHGGRLPSRELIDTEEFGESEDEWRELEAGMEVDPEYDEEVHPRLKYVEEYSAYPEGAPVRSEALPYDEAHPPVPSRATRRLPPEELYEDDYDEYEEGYEDEDEEERPRPRRRRKGGLTRRGLLMGIGAAAVVGTGVAAYEYGPKVPQALGEAGTNIEKQLQDAFNKGVAQGAEAARKELITALDNLEGFTLEGAVTAARLTRVAYDVFVSPVVQFGANIATDFLSAMLKAFKTARMLLAGVYQDNATLQAIQKVLESWVDQVTTMPKQLNSITQADLDGAQAYLRALQRKIEDEKKQLQNNGTPVAGTPTAQPNAKATPQATPKPK